MRRYIDAETLKAELKKRVEMNAEIGRCVTPDDLEDMIDDLSYESDDQHVWRHFPEEKPPVHEDVLVIDPKFGIRTDQLFTDGSFLSENVEWWMPIPEYPEGYNDRA